MAKGFVCIKCGYGTLVKSNMKLTPDGRPYCRNEVGCAARLAHKWAKPVEDRMPEIDLARETVFLKG